MKRYQRAAVGAREVAAHLNSHHRALSANQSEWPYTDAEVEFLLAMRQWMMVNGCKFPAFTDCLAVLVSLGYRQRSRGKR